MYKRLAGIAASAAVLVAACGGATSTSAPASAGASTAPASPTAAPSVANTADELFGTAYKPADGVDGGTIVIGDWQEANLFQPFYYGQVSEANVASAAWSSLVVLTNDFKYAPDEATTIPTVANGGVVVPGTGADAMTVTWTLKPDLKWSDGQPLTCDDYKYAWEWILDKDNVGVAKSGYTPIKDWECKSDTEMVLHYTEVNESYITVATSPLPRHYLSKFPIKDQVKGAGFQPDDMPNVPVSGAFKFQNVTPLQELTLAKNEYYKSPFTGKPAHLDTLKWKWYSDPDAMIAGYKGGEIDAATDLQDSDLVKIADLGDQVSAIPSLTIEGLHPNWSTPAAEDTTKGVGGCSHNAIVSEAVRGPGCPMADAAMREAVSYAIDKNVINDRILGGSVVVANTIISPEAWFYAAQPPVAYDPAKAIATLEAAGWKVGADGIREKDGLKAIVELCTTTRQTRQDTLALVADWLKAVGIQGIPNPVAPADIFAQYVEGTRDTACDIYRNNFDLAEYASSSSIDPYGNYLGYHSSQFEPEGANQASVNSPDIDKALDTVKSSVDFDVVKAAMADFQTAFGAQTAEIPLYYRKQVELHAPALGNFLGNPTQAGLTWNAGDWFKQP